MITNTYDMCCTCAHAKFINTYESPGNACMCMKDDDWHLGAEICEHHKRAIPFSVVQSVLDGLSDEFGDLKRTGAKA